MNAPISPALSAIVTPLPPGASAFLALDTRHLQVQVVALCNEIALDVVHKNDAAGPAHLSIWDTQRLRRFLGQAVEACNRVADPRQMEMWTDTDEAAA